LGPVEGVGVDEHAAQPGLISARDADLEVRLPFRPGRGDLTDEVLRWTAAAGEERFEIQDRLVQPWPDLGVLVSDVRARLGLGDGVWAGG
jgi:hypothetical protein